MQQKSNLVVRVQPMSGTTAYAPLVNRGDIEFGLFNAVDIVNAYTGVHNFNNRKNPDLRLVGAVFSIKDGLAVPNDSPVKSIKDLKGMRMPSEFTAQSTVQLIQDAMLATAGLSTADMKPFPVPDYLKGIQALGEGKVDAALVAVGSAAVQEANIALAAHGGLRILPVIDTPEAVVAMHKVFSGVHTELFMPSPAFIGVITPTRLLVVSSFLVASIHTPDDVVYKATKTLFENKESLVANSSIMKSFNPDTMAEANVVPYHPGAEKFYKESGRWPPLTR